MSPTDLARITVRAWLSSVGLTSAAINKLMDRAEAGGLVDIGFYGALQEWADAIENVEQGGVTHAGDNDSGGMPHVTGEPQGWRAGMSDTDREALIARLRAHPETAAAMTVRNRAADMLEEDGRRITELEEDFRVCKVSLEDELAACGKAEARERALREALSEELEDAIGRLAEAKPGSMGAEYEQRRVDRSRQALAAIPELPGTEPQKDER